MTKDYVDQGIAALDNVIDGLDKQRASLMQARYALLGNPLIGSAAIHDRSAPTRKQRRARNTPGVGNMTLNVLKASGEPLSTYNIRRLAGLKGFKYRSHHSCISAVCRLVTQGLARRVSEGVYQIANSN